MEGTGLGRSGVGGAGVDVAIVGAGMAGLAAARELTRLGRRVRVLDKGRGVGGRMATRRVGAARIDHGAQFFTVRSEAFAGLIDAAARAGAVFEWTRGFVGEGDGHPRWRGRDGMTALAKWMVDDGGLAPELGVRVRDLRDHPARAYLLTAPVPQSLALLGESRMLPAPPLARRLAEVHYKATIAVLAVLDVAPTGMPDHGGVPFDDHPDLAFVSDNQAKGVSPVPALTVHLSNRTSDELWDRADDEVVARAAELTADLRGRARFSIAEVQRWRYAGPVATWPEPTVVWGDRPLVALAGEAFAGPKVEGAFRSGVAAATALHERLG